MREGTNFNIPIGLTQLRVGKVMESFPARVLARMLHCYDICSSEVTCPLAADDSPVAGVDG